jgi:hypothetical protein
LSVSNALPRPSNFIVANNKATILAVIEKVVQG